jgi:5'-nucleotidase
MKLPSAFTLLSLAAVATSLFTTAAQAASNVTFLHVNDHHSHFEELSLDLFDDKIPTGLSVETSTVRLYYGSFARSAALMSQLQDEAVAAGSQVVKLHAGDALTGTVFYTFFGTEMDATAMNALELDAFVIGNHEFDDGDANLATFLEQVTFPVVSYNGKSRKNRNGRCCKSYLTYAIRRFQELASTRLSVYNTFADECTFSP